MPSNSVVEVSPGLWELRGVHPEWTQDNDGWDPEVAWWALTTNAGLLLIDPLITDHWEWLDERVQSAGGCAGVVRTIGYHERSVVPVAARYGAELSARLMPTGASDEELPSDFTVPNHPLQDGQAIAGGAAVSYRLSNADEIALWLPHERALIFGDAMNRDADGRLHPAPDDWLSQRLGAEQLHAELRGLSELEPLHLLVAHGPLVMGDGREAMRRALG